MTAISISSTLEIIGMAVILWRWVSYDKTITEDKFHVMSGLRANLIR